MGATANLILNLCLIPVWDAKGAVAASIAAEFYITILYMKNCGGILTVKQLKKFSVKRIAAGIVMAATLRLFSRLAISGMLLLMIQLTAGVIIYGLILILLKDNLVFELKGMLIKHIGGKRDKGHKFQED